MGGWRSLGAPRLAGSMFTSQNSSGLELEPVFIKGEPFPNSERRACVVVRAPARARGRDGGHGHEPSESCGFLPQARPRGRGQCPKTSEQSLGPSQGAPR